MFVYFIQSGNSKKPPIKIGVAGSIQRRMETLQIGNPEQIKLIATISCKSKKEAYNLEAYLHRQLKKRNIRGEWFMTCMRRVNKEVERYFSHNKIEYSEVRPPAYKQDFNKYYGSAEQDLDIQLLNEIKIYN